jgi:hypothetical protein
MELDKGFWAERYASGNTGWDIGSVSTPLKAYFDQLGNKDLRILIPGGGRSYEAEYLHRAGFGNVHVVDLAEAPFESLLERCPEFPREHLHQGNFFEHAGTYDRIIEQTFFCALPPALRGDYVETMYTLLTPGGILAGVLFDDPLFTDHPPFGGSADEYRKLFAKRFPTVSVEPCYNSIKPRAGREVWLRAQRIGGANA